MTSRAWILLSLIAVFIWVAEQKFAKGEKIFAAWVASCIPRNAEAVVKTGFDMAFFDLQHGEGGFVEVCRPPT